MQSKRSKIWIHSLQTHLMLRVAMYCILFQVATWFMLSTVVRLESLLKASAPELSLGNGFVILAALGTVFGAMFVWDAVKLTHRLVGPLVRFRRVFQQISEGKEVELIRLRKGDFLQEVAESINGMVKSLHDRGQVTLKSTELPQEPSQSAFQWAPAFCALLVLAIAATYVWWVPVMK